MIAVRQQLKKLLNKIGFRGNPLFLLLLSLVLVLIFGVRLMADTKQVHHLTIAAGPAQGESYLLSQAIAQKVATCNPKIQIHVLETLGSQKNIELLENNKVELATAPINNSALPSTKLVTLLYSDVFQLVVTEKSGIKEVSDLKGKRIALAPDESSQDDFFWLLTAHYRLSPRDFTYQEMVREKADEAFHNNQVDAVFRVRPPGNRPIQQLVQNSGGRLVPIDQASAIKINYPEFEPAIIPKGAYQGNVAIPAIDLPTVAIQRMLVANARVDSEIIREITRILYEHRQELTRRMPLANQISPPNQDKGTLLPLHPGAAAYYDRNKPNFIEQNADSLGLILTVVLAVGSWIWQLKQQVEKVQKNRSDRYNKQIVQLIKDIQQCGDLSTLETFRDLLYEEFEIVVDALDKDSITPEAFQSLKFTWEAAMYALRDREAKLVSSASSRMH
ncbi:MAG: TAXI family TRAP transporter solute-binding subunit [Heteroscytonema crispum UTEX LB 1556]